MRNVRAAFFFALLWAPLAGLAAPVVAVIAFPGDGAAEVRFTVLSFDSTVVSYTATSSPGGITGTAPGPAHESGRVRVTGLTNGTAYRFTITAHHADGTSETSLLSRAATPRRLPPRTAPWAYVPSGGDALVTVIDTSTDQVIDAIEVGEAPSAVAVNPTGTRVYVAHGDGVDVIDTATQSVVATIPVADGPYVIDVDPSGAHAYTGNGVFLFGGSLGPPSVSVIDTSTNTVTDTIPLPDVPGGIEVDPSGASVYVSIPNLNEIVRIDTVTRTIAATSPALPVQPSGLAAGPGDLLYAADQAGGQLATLSRSTLAFQSATTLPSGSSSSCVAVDATSGNVFFARFPSDGSGPGTVNELNGGAAPVGFSPAGLEATPDGTKLYVVDGDSRVTVVDPVRMVPITTIQIAAFPSALGRFIAPADPDPPRLANLSTRSHVLTGDDVMITGFTVGGTVPKTLAITATGPSLSAFGIANPLANPTLTLVRQSDHAVIAANDDWQADPDAAQLLASGFAPTDPRESGLYVTLPPGAYTAIVSGADGGVGVGVAGVFEVDHPELPLVNLSTRAEVLTGDNVMIAGLIVQGSAPRTMLITATGPSLASFGIATPLPDPKLTLVRQSDHAVIATNDDWQSSPDAAEIAASGIAPADPHESALLVTLPPGAYTALVEGANGGFGVSVVGVFALP